MTHGFLRCRRVSDFASAFAAGNHERNDPRFYVHDDGTNHHIVLFACHIIFFLSAGARAARTSARTAETAEAEKMETGKTR